MLRSCSAELLVLGKRGATWILLAVMLATTLLFAYLLPYATLPRPGGAGDATARLAPCCPSACSPPCWSRSPSTAGRWC